MWLTQGSGTRIARRGATKKVSFGESSVNGSGGILTVRVYKHYASLGVERSTPCEISAWPRHVGLQQGLKYRVITDSEKFKLAARRSDWQRELRIPPGRKLGQQRTDSTLRGAVRADDGFHVRRCGSQRIDISPRPLLVLPHTAGARDDSLCKRLRSAEDRIADGVRSAQDVTVNSRSIGIPTHL
jgi:hypothetical protein